MPTRGVVLCAWSPDHREIAKVGQSDNVIERYPLRKRGGFNI